MGGANTHELGVTVGDEGATFRVWAPFADAVFVTGDFNDWADETSPLAKDDDGNWSATIEGVTAGQAYKFVIKHGDETIFRNDPRALQFTASGDSPVVVDPTFDWEGDSFQALPYNQQVIYEMHIGTFHRSDAATSGTFATATEKLDYLKDLGITTIELMPCFEMWKGHGWGYAPNYIYAIEESYGGRHAFMKFVKEAHERGIGVILDVVYNHLSPDPSLSLLKFDGWSENGNDRGIYFYSDWRAVTPWGDTRFDYGRPEVRQYITDNVRMWMQDCHVDGLRVDSTHHMRSVVGSDDDHTQDLPEGWQMLQEITGTARAINPQALLIAEDAARNDYLTKPTNEQGAGFDAQWALDVPYFLRLALESPDDAWRDLPDVQNALTRRFNDDAFQRVIFSESHDTDANGNARLNEKISPGDGDNLFARRRSGLAAVLVLTSPGIPMLFQGQEFMEDGSFTEWRALDWRKTEEFSGMLQLYKDLIALRRNVHGTSAGLLGQSFAVLHLDDSAKLFAYHRYDHGGAGDDVVVVLNCTNEPRQDYQIKFPRPGIWKARFNSDWQGYSPDFINIPTPDVIVENDTGVVNLAPYSAVIFSQDSSS